MFAIQLHGSPFDDRTLILLEVDGVQQRVYVSNTSDDTATIVDDDDQDVTSTALADHYADGRATGFYSERTVVIIAA